MSAPSSFASAALLGVSGRDDQRTAAILVARGGDRGQSQQPDGAGTDDHGLVTVVAQRGVCRARGRFDHHRGLVAEIVGNVDQLAGVGDHPRAPAATGVGAEAALQPGFEVAERDALAQVGAPRRALAAQRS